VALLLKAEQLSRCSTQLFCHWQPRVLLHTADPYDDCALHDCCCTHGVRHPSAASYARALLPPLVPLDGRSPLTQLAFTMQLVPRLCTAVSGPMQPLSAWHCDTVTLHDPLQPELLLEAELHPVHHAHVPPVDTLAAAHPAWPLARLHVTSLL
jgi:hypothetical protein